MHTEPASTPSPAAARPGPGPASAPAHAARRRLPTWKKALFALVPLLAILLTAELVIRLVRAPTWFGSFRLLRVDQVRRGYPAMPDAELGYVPEPSFASRDNHWGTTVTIDAQGFRSNGVGRPVPSGRPVVAVGDSFTFGDQVDDDETWPSYLELELGQPVHNAGVFGYSLAQAVLRAERVLRDVPAEWLVVSYIPDDIRRCELAKRYAPVPWFEVEGGALQLRNVPVVDPTPLAEVGARRFKNLIGHSAVVDALCANLARSWWIGDEKEVRALPPGKGGEVALLLVDRIAAYCRARGCKLLLVLQGEELRPDADDPGDPTAASLAMLERARSLGVPTLDLIAAAAEAERRTPGVRAGWFDGHMTAEGNRWAAEQIARCINGSR